jgi:hypothetical protein
MRSAAIAINDEVSHKAIDRIAATASGRVREAMEMAAANPEFVFFGRNAATQRSHCAWLARLLLHVRRSRRSRSEP